MHASFAIPRLRSPSLHALRLHSSRRSPSVVSVDVHGDIDASNADELRCYVSQVRGPRDDMVLDLSGVTFFGTHGFSILMLASARGAVVVTSPVVDRMLGLCDPESQVSVAADVEAAIDMLRDRPRPALEFVTDLRSRI